MATINLNYDRLCSCYLLSEVARRLKVFTGQHPGRELYRLDRSQNTQPLTPSVIQVLHETSERMRRCECFGDYGHYQGEEFLRESIARLYAERGVEFGLDEIFVNDGAKNDLGNIQTIFGPDDVVAVQDPTFPAYVDTNVMAGRAEAHNAVTCQYSGIAYMPCHERNGFFPEPPREKVDLIYLCCPNNPTGATATRDQLEQFVHYALTLKAVIIFDAGYSAFITDPRLPKSIYDIKGAERCAIEISSLSNSAAFTSLRIGWTIVPKTLAIEDASAGKLNALWHRRQSAVFNGPSIIAQFCAAQALSPAGRLECQSLVDDTMQNARVIRDGLRQAGITCYGGEHSPYVWSKVPNGVKSMSYFSKLLTEANVVSLPGAGFGPNGEGYVRLSAFERHEHVQNAMANIQARIAA